MGASNGRLHDLERKTNSSLSHDSDFSLSATSVEYTDTSYRSSKSVSFQGPTDSEAESGKSEREDGGVGGGGGGGPEGGSSRIEHYRHPYEVHVETGNPLQQQNRQHHHHHHAIPNGTGGYPYAHVRLRCPNKRVVAPPPCRPDAGPQSGSNTDVSDPETGANAAAQMARLASNHRISPRVFPNHAGPLAGVGGGTLNGTVTPKFANGHMVPPGGRTSPGHDDLGYHTLITKDGTLGSQPATPPVIPTALGRLPPHFAMPGANYAWDSVCSTNGVTMPSSNHFLGQRVSPRQLSNCIPYNYHSPLGAPPDLDPMTADTSHLLMSTYKGKRVSRSSPMDRLDDDVVLKVFSYLSTNQLLACARVCRRWYFLTWEPKLWSTVELTGDTIPVDRALRTIFQLLCRDSPSVCLTVEKVVLNGCTKLTDRGLTTIARHCPELRRLEMKGCHQVTNDGLFELVSCCVNIEHLDITGCLQINCINISGHQFQTPEADALLRSRQLYLQFLDMTDCQGLEDVGLKLIVRNCPQLMHLYLRRCVGLTDVGVKCVASYCVMLRELSVSDCIQVTDFGMYELAKLGPNLRYLSVAKCDQISDAGIKQIAKLCYKLRYLNVRGCEAVSDDSIVMLARSCPRLRALDIGKCDVTDHGLKLLSENCPNLKKLSMKSCDMITDKGIQCIAYYCRGLQQMNIQDCQITIEGYRMVKKYCKRCIIEHTNPGFY